MQRHMYPQHTVALGVVAVLWASFAWRSEGAQISARSPVVQIINGRILQNQTLTVLCPLGEWDSGSVFTNTFNGVDRAVTITCRPLQYIYELQYMGVTARDGRLIRLRSCVQRPGLPNTSASNAIRNSLLPSNADLEDAAQQGGGGGGPSRRLLMHAIGYRFPDDYRNDDFREGEGLCEGGSFGATGIRHCPTISLEQSLEFCYGNSREPKSCIRGWINQYRGFNGSIPDLWERCPGAVRAMNSECSVAFQARTSQRLRTAIEKDTKAFLLYLQEMNSWTNGVTENVKNLTLMDQLLWEAAQKALNASRNTTDVIIAKLGEANDRVLELANITENKFRDAQTKASGILNELNASIRTIELNTAAGLVSLAAEVRTTIATEFRRVLEAVGNVTRFVNDRMTYTENQLNAFVDQQISENRHIMRRIREVQGVLLSEVELRQFQIDLITLVRTSLLTELRAGRDPFLPNTGAAPRVNLDEARTILVESVVMVFQDPATPTKLKRRVVALRCDLRWMLRNPTNNLDWAELLRNVGPPACDPTIPDDCACSVQIERQSCTRTSPAATTTLLYTRDLRLVKWEPSVDGACTNVPDQDAVVVHRRPVEFLRAMRDLCIETTGVQYRMGGLLTNRVGTFTNDGTKCDPQQSELDSLGVSNHNPLVPILGFWDNGWATVSLAFDNMFDSLYGVLPSALQYRWDYFVHAQGVSKRCLTASYITTNGTVPVYRIVPVAVRASVEVTETGAGTRIYTDVVPSTALARVLPGASYFVVGDPRDNQTLYDIPPDAIALDPNAATRAGTATYLFTPAGEPWNASRWIQRNGMLPEHDRATNFPSAYRASIDPQTNECRGGQAAFAGSWCAIRSLYNVQTQVGNSSRLTFVPKSQSSYEVQIVLQQGDVTQQLISVCPLVTIIPQGGGTLLVLSNPTGGAASNRVQLSVVTTDGVCDALYDETIPPGGSVRRFVPRCVGAAVTRATVYLTDGVTATACSGATDMDITSSALIYSTVYGNLGAYYVNLTQADSVDQTLLRIQRVLLGIQERMTALFTGTVDAFVFAGIPIPVTAFSTYVNATRNVSFGAAFPPVEERPTGTLNLDLSDFDRFVARYQGESDNIRAQIIAAARRGDDVFSAAQAQLESNTRQAMALRNATNALEERTQAYVETYMVRQSLQALFFEVATRNMEDAAASGGGGGLGGALGSVTSFVASSVGFVARGVLEGASWAIGLAEDLAGMALKAFRDTMGIFSSFMGIMISLAITLVLAVVAAAGTTVIIIKRSHK